MKARLIVAVFAAFALLVGVVGPVAADNDAGVFEGNATVGKQYAFVNTLPPNPGPVQKTDHCDDQNAHELQAWGTGLFVPQVDDPTRSKTGTWHFKTIVTGATSSGQLDACGTLGPNALGVGASCGMSEGEGKGKIRLDMVGDDKAAKKAHDGQIILLDDIHWLTSAGGVLPITADATWADHEKVEKDKTAQLVAEVIASGGGPCVDTKSKEKKGGGGAQNFTVVGVYELIQV